MTGRPAPHNEANIRSNENPLLTSIEKELPSKELIDAIRQEVSGISPTEQVTLDRQEIQAGRFIKELLGKHIGPVQTDYLDVATNVAISEIDFERTIDLIQEGNELQVDISEPASYLHNRQYWGYKYKVGDTVQARKNGAVNAERAGLLSTIRVIIIEDRDPETAFKIPLRGFNFSTGEEIKLPTKEINVSEQVRPKLLVHEKVHGVQDHTIPLPLMEMQANWVAVKFFSEGFFGVDKEKGQSVSARQSRIFDQMLQEIGEDLHKLCFGTLNSQDRGEAMSKVQKSLTEDRLSEALPDDMEWVSYTKRELEEMLAEQSTTTEQAPQPSTHPQPDQG